LDLQTIDRTADNFDITDISYYGKVQPRTVLSIPEEEMYSSITFFNLGARWGWVDKVTPQPLYSEKKPVTLL
jgi:hypothetical protein